MKTRFQHAGAPYGARDKVLWSGDMPMMSGFPGVRVTLLGDNDQAFGYQVMQVCFEVSTEDPEGCEQVVYVKPVDPDRQLLVE